MNSCMEILPSLSASSLLISSWMSSAQVLSTRPNYWKMSLICEGEKVKERIKLTVRHEMKPALLNYLNACSRLKSVLRLRRLRMDSIARSEIAIKSQVYMYTWCVCLVKSCSAAGLFVKFRS